ncbi:MAG: type II secretion system major pseudopilin GspG [Henriciella sp.]
MLEILVVLAIMAVIASLVGPQLFGQLDRSKARAAELQIQSIEASLGLMHMDIGRYPTEAEGLTLLEEWPGTNRPASWTGDYLTESLPMDPWGRPYLYGMGRAKVEGYSAPPVVYSLGRDGRPGGEGLDSDLGSIEQLANPITQASLASN